MPIEKDQSQLERHFLTRSGEKLLFASRTHVFVLIAPIVLTIIFACVSIVAVIFVGDYFSLSFFILGGSIFLILFFCATMLMKVIVDWYFHFYVITNFKILEISYRPFFSKDINLLPLDQMRCVELTSRTQGFIKTMYDVGDIVIQLDFLTHQDTFVISDIFSPQETSMMLSDVFNGIISGKTGEKVTHLVKLKDENSESSSLIRRKLTNIIQMKGGEEYDAFL